MEHAFDYLPENLRTRAQFVLESFTRRMLEQNGEELTAVCDDTPLPPVMGYDAAPGGCGGHTRFRVPYEREDGQIGSLEACAICDGAVVWARFAEAA